MRAAIHLRAPVCSEDGTSPGLSIPIGEHPTRGMMKLTPEQIAKWNAMMDRLLALFKLKLLSV
jgi:hypothetical protein